MLTSVIIGGRIKESREDKKISQQLMVDRLKDLGISMSRETLSKIENGNRTVSAVELKAICSVLDLDVEILLQDSEDDSLVTLFRKRNMNEEAIKGVETLQEMIMSFMNQKKILNSNTITNVEPLWRS
ncbi:transcriptional regulator [Clostridium sporogenes]|uniref:helix-turn-helix domain-containing protein n=1 Tax=Clostridium TaxID=1485 RepID=UPI0007177566|nr:MULTISPECIES: helix-turn-helix transcriptional regulator [Clostridium]KRU25023.1 transcriptional regulator [Clostridium sporogenes]KRU31916.1 transcriptional regulator [Clostridium sporogenes]KRU34184.1 transcriptional regulator [Clostridium sporogenes]KRU41201.1 transcriptional regulator [Clostridium sporogenes]MBZ1328211.1 helix-turn-helix transcriptional regulator [Clostridium botulinum]